MLTREQQRHLMALSETLDDPPATAVIHTLIVIVNYRTADLVLDCLRSLEAEVASLPGTRVAIVDNDSRDGSASKLRDTITENSWQSWAEVESSPENGGFAKGNNVAIRAALANPKDRPEYVLLLNPDTAIRPGAVRELRNFLEKNVFVGIAGSRLEDPDETQQASCFRFYSLWSEIDNGFRFGPISRLLKNHVAAPAFFDEPHEVEWVSGASMMVRSSVFDQIGLMDERYFLYYEESDFCLRAHRQGHQCWHVPKSRVVHYIGASTKVTGDAERIRRRPKYWFESRRHYFRKNHGVIYQLLCDSLWLVGFSAWRLRRRIQRKPDTDPPHLWWDFFRYSLLGL